VSDVGTNGDSLHCHVRRWVDWPKDELATEISNRMRHFYGQTDGTMQFPSSAEGDLLKMVHVLLSPTAPADRTAKAGMVRRDVGHSHKGE